MHCLYSLECALALAHSSAILLDGNQVTEILRAQSSVCVHYSNRINLWAARIIQWLVECETRSAHAKNRDMMFSCLSHRNHRCVTFLLLFFLRCFVHGAGNFRYDILICYDAFALCEVNDFVAIFARWFEIARFIVHSSNRNGKNSNSNHITNQQRIFRHSIKRSPCQNHENTTRAPIDDANNELSIRKLCEMVPLNDSIVCVMRHSALHQSK